MRCKCGEHVESGRVKLGIHKCLACGEAEASLERAAKAKRVSLAYPKGPHMYMGAPEIAAKNLMDSTDTRRSNAAVLTTSTPVRVAVALNRSVKEKAKAIGIYWSPGEHPPKGGTVYYSDDDPNLSKAIRVVKL